MQGPAKKNGKVPSRKTGGGGGKGTIVIRGLSVKPEGSSDSVQLLAKAGNEAYYQI